MASKEMSLEFQQAFAIHDGQFNIPEIITQTALSDETADLIRQRPLWQDRPKGQLLYLNTLNGSAIDVIKPGTWQVVEEIDESSTRDRYSYTGLIVLTSPINDLSEASLLAQSTQNILGLLKKSSPVIVLEEKGGELEDLRVRREVLQDIDLVKASILKDISKDYLFWESRKEKVRTKREPVDLTSEDWKYYQRLRKMWRKMAGEYQKNGFELVDPEKLEILKRLKSSKMPHLDMQALRLGFGVEVKNKYCGCHWKIDMKGNEERVWHCGTCDKVSPKEISVPKVLYVQGEETITKKCSCGKELIRNVRLIKELKNGEVRILVNVTCSSHGDKDLREITVSKDQFVRREDATKAPVSFD